MALAAMRLYALASKPAIPKRSISTCASWTRTTRWRTVWGTSCA